MLIIQNKNRCYDKWRKTMYGAIEAGGTKFVCAVVDNDKKIIEKATFDTLEPSKTLKNVIEFLGNHKIEGIGIGTFGPVDIDKSSKTYGMILNTPKVKWRNFSFYDNLKEHFDVPINIDTDVNAAALGEYRIGAGRGKKSVLYITIGTGVGAGFVFEGKTLQGLSHPEMGHILIRQHKNDKFEGNCPTHKNCLEGLVSGPSIEARYGVKGHLLEPNHIIWDFIADYIGQALMNYCLILSPEIILIGGGVSQQQQLFDKIRYAFKRYMNDYIQHPVLQTDLSDYIRYPELGQLAGLYGSIELAFEK